MPHPVLPHTVQLTALTPVAASGEKMKVVGLAKLTGDRMDSLRRDAFLLRIDAEFVAFEHAPACLLVYCRSLVIDLSACEKQAG